MRICNDADNHAEGCACGNRPRIPTTARVLADYRRDLIVGGFEPETAEMMARDAADILIRGNGLVVGDLNQSEASA